MRALLFLLRLEWLRLLRTPEVTHFLLLPSLLFVPLIAAVVIALKTGLEAPPRVALPLDVPPELALSEALAEEDLQGVWSGEPALAFARGEVDAAVISWRGGDGLAESWPPLEGSTRWRWKAEVLSAEVRVGSRVKDAIEAAGERQLRGWIAASGVGPEEVLRFAQVQVIEPEEIEAPRASPATGPGGLALTLLVVAAISQYLVPVVHLSDRLSGVSESLIVTPAGPGALICARLFAFTALELVAVGLTVANMQLLMRAGGIGEGIDPSDLPGPVVAALLINASFLGVSLSASTVQGAVTRASILLFALVGLGALGHYLDHPGVPLGGLFAAKTPGEHLLALSSSAATVVLVTALCVQSFTGQRALPPGHV